MLIMKNLNLISVQSWTYCKSLNKHPGAYFKFRRRWGGGGAYSEGVLIKFFNSLQSCK